MSGRHFRDLFFSNWISVVEFYQNWPTKKKTNDLEMTWSIPYLWKIFLFEFPTRNYDKESDLLAIQPTIWFSNNFLFYFMMFTFLNRNKILAVVLAPPRVFFVSLRLGNALTGHLRLAFDYFFYFAQELSRLGLRCGWPVRPSFIILKKTKLTEDTVKDHSPY